MMPIIEENNLFYVQLNGTTLEKAYATKEEAMDAEKSIIENLIEADCGPPSPTTPQVAPQIAATKPKRRP